MGTLGFSDARHLVTRTGFGAEWDTIQRYQNMSRDQAINHLLKNKDYHFPPAPRASPWSTTVSMRNNMRRKRMIKHVARTKAKACKTGGSNIYWQQNPRFWSA